MARRRRRQPARPGGPKRKKYRKPPPPPEAKIPDTPEAKLEEEVRSDIKKLLASKKKDLGLTEDERLLDRILEQHPEHQETFEKAEEWTVTGSAESPFLHAALHRIVEQRVVSREMGRLNAGVPWHDAVHEGIELVEVEIFPETDEEPVEVAG